MNAEGQGVGDVQDSIWKPNGQKLPYLMGGKKNTHKSLTNGRQDKHKENNIWTHLSQADEGDVTHGKK